ncbi:hypothetical protein JTB14_009525 [Gonioctena quinquepunctata]|nr:hypothetical protein JTB14_009525 [Gonioctena quinquepunctata]
MSLVNKQDDIPKEIENLKHEIGNIRMDGIPHSSQTNNDEIINEIYERQTRSKNIMIFNLPEGERYTTDSDITKVKCIFKDITDDEVKITRVARLGKQNKNGARALKVVLDDAQDVLYVLRNRTKVNKERNIIINADQTPMQMAQYKSVQNTLQRNVATSLFDIIILNETWLTQDFSDAELGLTNYTVFRKDRSPATSPFSRGGGVLIAVRETYKCAQLPSNESIEDLFVSIGDSSRHIFGAVYLPPKPPITSFLTLSSDLDAIVEKYPDTTLYVFGDFNLPNAYWTSDALGSTAAPTPSASAMEIEAITTLSNTCALHNLYQLNNNPNERNVLLDLAFSHESLTLSPAHEHLLAPDPHHPPLQTSINLISRPQGDINNASEFYYDFKGADFDGILTCLESMDWDLILSNKSLDEMVNIFYDALYSLFDVFVPKKKYSSGKFPIWFSPELKNLIFEKKTAHKKYKSWKSERNFRVFCELRSRCKILSKECYNTYLIDCQRSIHTNPRFFWKFVNSKRKINNIPNEMSLEDKRVDTGQDIANLFAEYFATVYSTTTCPNLDLPTSNNLNLSSFKINISQIYDKLCHLDPKIGPGPDAIPPSILKHCSFVLS